MFDVLRESNNLFCGGTKYIFHLDGILSSSNRGHLKLDIVLACVFTSLRLLSGKPGVL